MTIDCRLEIPSPTTGQGGSRGSLLPRLSESLALAQCQDDGVPAVAVLVGPA